MPEALAERTLRIPDKREYFHDEMGDAFARALSEYDTRRRMDILVDRFLPEDFLRGRTALEVGCGLGFFSARLQERGAVVTATDVGENLVAKTRERVGCECRCVDALSLREYFGADRFDVVLSSECIEHTPDPMRAVQEMVGVLKPGGILALSTPNLIWYPMVRAATALRLRPFDGLENFTTFGRLRRTLEAAGAEVLEEYGLHMFPFQLPLHSLSKWCDERLQCLRWAMINICILAGKITADNQRVHDSRPPRSCDCTG